MNLLCGELSNSPGTIRKISLHNIRPIDPRGVASDGVRLFKMKSQHAQGHLRTFALCQRGDGLSIGHYDALQILP